MGLQVEMPENRVVPSGLIASIGVVLGLSAVVYVDTRPSQPWWWTVEVAVAGTFPAVLLYSGYRLASSDFDSRDLWRIFAWTVVGLVGLATLTGLLFVHQQIEGSSLVEPGFTVSLLAMGGALFGMTAAVSHRRRTSVTVPGPDERPGLDPHRSHFQGTDETSPPRVEFEPQEVRRRMEIIEYAAAIGELSLRELTAELSGQPGGPFGDDFDQVQVRLYQFDLPRVARTGRIDFDPETEMIRYTGRPTLDMGRTDTLR